MQIRRLLLLAVILLLACSTAIHADETTEQATPDATLTSEEESALAAKSESFEFQAEVHRLMDIIINSLYSKREIFLRELISNSADALDKIRYLALTNQTSLGEQEKLEVRISFDKDAKTLTVRDSGIGMTREDLKRNLGIVAKSGTSEFVDAATKGQDALALIGQFGVGFYSVYLVADKVTVVSKHPNDTQQVWESMADKTFTVGEDPRGDTLGRGTQVTLHLKEDAVSDFANEHELRKLVKRYSEFIDYPIYLLVTKSVEKEIPDEDAIREAEEAKTKKEEEKAKKEAEKAEKLAAGETVEEEEEEIEVQDDEDTKPKVKKVTEQVKEWERVNDVKAIWTRNARDITDEEYADFYKQLTKDEEGPLEKIHFQAEGEITFRSILYVPKKAPHGLYDRFYEKSTALKLYVRRVLISDEFEDFLPRYLNFIKGVVDSEDLPLNVSRETLAQSRVLKVMAKKITRKVLDMLKKMAEAAKSKDEEEDEGEEKKDEENEKKDTSGVKAEEKYGVFWKEFGKSIKLGVIDDRANRAKLAKLLRYQTSKSEGKVISLEEYVDRMNDKQKHIYYITGESLDAVKKSPFLERLASKGLEVVFMVDPLDEYLVQSLTEFDGTPLQSITKEGLKLGDEDRLEKWKEELKPLTDWLASVYGDKVEKVTVSNRIATSPCVLVSGQYGWSANMERIMKAQTFANADEATWLHSKKTMEINPRHPIIKELATKVSEVAEGEKPESLLDLANLLYDSALLSSGFMMKDTQEFSKRIQRLISTGLNIDPNAEVEPEPEDSSEPEQTEETKTEDSTNTNTESEATPSDAEHAHDEL